ncbi:MAG: hypothetical protein KDA65_00490 [Planctomycetaceae bacterium]|nr:hypothetical protein [Planctomycetaceae bacterium]
MDDQRSNQKEFTPPDGKLVLRVFSYARELTATIEPGTPVLIGSGPSCHIRIEALPPLHSMVTYDGKNAPRLCPVTSVPLVLVNGKLKDGQTGEQITFSDQDTLHIGLRVIVRLMRMEAVAAEPVPLPEPLAQEPTLLNSKESSPDRERENLMHKPLNELTAAELIELLEQEEQQVAEFESNQKSGLQKLLQAVKQVGEGPDREPAPATIPLTSLEAPSSNNQPVIEQEIHYLVEELSELVEDLCKQIQLFAEAESDDGAETTFKKLLREQHDILEKLDTIAELIGDKSDPSPVLRKIA